ncbi:hypothetical protein BH11BAC2_BH11BAC2_20600 [soil metagenome]
MLAYIILLFSSIGLQAKPQGEKDKKTPDTTPIFVLAPKGLSEQQLKNYFGQNALRLDTTALNMSVQRIGLIGKVFDSIPFNTAYFPNTRQLLIANDQYIPKGIEGFPKLSSLKIGRSNVNPSINTTDGDIPPKIVFDLDSILNRLPLLEELYLPEHIKVPILLERTMAKSVLKVLQVQSYSLPIFLLNNKHKATITGLSNGIPYPEIAVLAASGYKATFPIKEDSIPFWVPSSKYYKKPKFTPFSANGNFSMSYPNGQLIVSGSLLNAQPEGEWKFWYANGKLCEQRSYRNGREAGVWLYFNESGDTSSVLEFDGNGRFSKMLIYFRDSIAYGPAKPVSHIISKSEFNVSMNTHSQTTRRFYSNNPNDSLISVQVRFFIGEVSRSHKTLYYSGDRLIKEIEYTDSLNAPKAVTTTFDLRGNPTMKHVSVAARTLDSVFYSNGHISEVRIMEGDLLKTFSWDSTGIKLSDCQFSGSDSLYGVCKFYFPNGQVSQVSNYYKGKIHGNTNVFDQSGTLIEERVYENGVLIKSTKKH